MLGSYNDLIEEGRVSPLPFNERYCNQCRNHLLGKPHWRKCGMKSPPWLIGYKEEYTCFDCEPISSKRFGLA